MLLERCVSNRPEWCVVDAFEFPIGVELRDAVEDVEVGFVRGTDDELSCLPYCPACRTSFEFVDPLHRCQDVAFVVLHLAELVHVLDGCGLEVYGETCSEFVSGFDDVAFSAGHYFEVDVAVVAVFVADNVDDLDHAFGGLGASACDAGAQEESVYGVPFGKFDEGFGEFVDLEGVSFSRYPVGVRAEMAVHLAEVGEHDLHEVGELAVGESRAVDAWDRVVTGVVVWSAFFDRSWGMAG